MEHLRFTSKMDSKGRVTVPQVIRESLGLHPGTYFEVTVDTERRHIVLRPMVRGLEEGVIVEAVVRVRDTGNLIDMVNKCVGEGYDIMKLNCVRNEVYECTLNIYAADAAIGERLRDVLGAYGLVNIRLIA